MAGIGLGIRLGAQSKGAQQPGPGFTLIAHNAASGTASIVTSGNLVTTGANLIVVITSSYGGGAVTVTDTVNGSGPVNTYTARTKWVSPNTSATLQIWDVVAPAVGATHAVTIAGTAPSIVVMAFSGAANPAYFDTQNGQALNGVITLNTGTISPNGARNLIVSGLCVSGPATAFGVDSSMLFDSTLFVPYVPSVNIPTGGAYKIGQSGPINPQWSWGGGALDAAAGIVSYIPA